MQLRKMHEEALKDKQKCRTAAIQVENIKGTIMLISGTRDRLWSATYMSEKIMKRLKANDFDFHYEHNNYNSGHNGIIMNKDCWRNIFAFLSKCFVLNDGVDVLTQ